MTTLAQYGSKKTERANAALEAISNGGNFNGTVYSKASRKKGYMEVSVYVSNQLFFFGEIETADVEAVKAEFLASVPTNNASNSEFGSETEFGTHNWLFSGMNAE